MVEYRQLTKVFAKAGQDIVTSVSLLSAAVPADIYKFGF